MIGRIARAAVAAVAAAATIAAAVPAVIVMVLSLGTLSPAPAHAGEATWVFFRDRGSAQVESESPLTPRAIERRRKAWEARVRSGARHGAGADATAPNAIPPATDAPATDAPPAPADLAALIETGARIRTVSRWMNAASVEADAAVLDRIRSLPFVAETRPVERLQSNDAEGLDAPPARDPASDPAHNPAPAEPGDVADAGPSYAQLARIGIPEAHALGYHGQGVWIGILDSGFATTHEALRHLDVRARRDFVQHDDDTADDPGGAPPDPIGQQNHGTQVLSLLGAYQPGSMIGAAPAAGYILAKTERTSVENPAEEDDWCAGLEWAEAMGADVITTSLSYTRWYANRDLDGRTAVTTRMANLAWERGVVLLNSAGNSGPGPSTLGAPADAPGEITVGATDPDGLVTGFSSRGPTGDGRVKPDVVGPGSGVLVVRGGARDGYQRGGGTSYSTPLVAGVAALVVEAHPDWSPEAVREAVVMSGDRADRPDNDYGWGTVNARDAILYPLLEGRATAEGTGRPVAGARVVWERTATSRGEWAAPGDAPPTGETTTDAGGAFTIGNLPPGSYRLTVAGEGYEAVALGPFDVPPNLGRVDATLTPQRTRKSRSASEEPRH